MLSAKLFCSILSSSEVAGRAAQCSSSAVRMERTQEKSSAGSSDSVSAKLGALLKPLSALICTCGEGAWSLRALHIKLTKSGESASFKTFL